MFTFVCQAIDTILKEIYLTGDIEKYGSGFMRIRKAIKDYPTMKVEYEEIGKGFMATISYTEQKTSSAKRVTEDVTENVTERSSRILSLMRETPTITTEQIAEILSVTKRTIIRDIEKMKKNNQIKYIGSAKSGSWKINLE